MIKKLLCGLAAIFTFTFSTSATLYTPNVVTNASNSITLGNLEKTDTGIYKMPVTLVGSLKSYSISVTNAKLKLTSVSGTGYKFINGYTGSTTDSTPSINKDYVSVKLEVSAVSASLNSTAKAALETIRYNSIANNTSINITADTALLQSGDYYLNGHYYTLSSFSNKSWADGMTWAYNLQSTDATRKYAYSGYISYPVIIDSVTEHNFVNALTSSSKFIFLPAVPVTCNAGSISVTGDDGNKTVTVVGEPKVSTDISTIYGHGEYWKWLNKTGTTITNTTTTSAGANLLPNESGTVSKTVSGTYWCYDNPTNGGMVYTAHPTVPNKWDDLATGGSWGNNVWSSPISGGNFTNCMYALAEWESGGDTTASATWSASTKTITYMNGTSVYNSETYIEGIGKESLISGPTAPEGQEFIGWYDQSVGGNPCTKIANTSRGDITLYARFRLNEPLTGNNLGGYYKNGSTKKQIVMFGFTFADYINLNTGDTCGIYLYSDAGSSKVKDFYTQDISAIKANEGRFYCIYGDDETIVENATYYAKAYVVTGGSTIYSSLLSAAGNYITEYKI